MKDISNKITTFRTAKAVSVLKISNASVRAIKNNTTSKKDVLATARASAFLAAKNVSNVIPHCHPIPIDSVRVDFEFIPIGMQISVEVKTIYKTGCEMEALYGASVASLTIYDMLKPTDKKIEIVSLKLESKSGGKSDFSELPKRKLNASVIVISDSISKGKNKDNSGLYIKEKLKTFNIKVEPIKIVPDEAEEINSYINSYVNKGIDIIITTGGTGLSTRDQTVDVVKKIINKEIGGIMETSRFYGQQRTPFSMLSRGIAGMKGKSLIITLPGSINGVKESMDALFPYVLHIFQINERNYRHTSPKN